jgi:hypothetical protein
MCYSERELSINSAVKKGNNAHSRMPFKPIRKEYSKMPWYNVVSMLNDMIEQATIHTLQSLNLMRILGE